MMKESKEFVIYNLSMGRRRLVNAYEVLIHPGAIELSNVDT